jgi:hypothetical protein
VKGDSKKEATEYFFLDLFGNNTNSLFTKNRTNVFPAGSKKLCHVFPAGSKKLCHRPQNTAKTTDRPDAALEPTLLEVESSVRARLSPV